MCGIAGIFAPAISRQALVSKAHRMSSVLSHRGPDSEGLWADPNLPLVLSHRRLSIIDLSPAGAQPMLSADARWVITYNGEIFNHGILREKLEKAGHAPPWMGHSDTEVLLACISAWGVDTTLRAVEGQFAFAVWDREERQLTLARDRAGEKPLIFGWSHGQFLFASELRAIHVAADGQLALDRSALSSMLELGHIPGHLSPYSHVRKVPPASYISFREADLVRQTTEDQRKYWQLPPTRSIEGGSLTAGEMIDELEYRIKGAVQRQLVADVPVGVFLSGGVDSSTVLAMAQSLSSRPIKSFTIGLSDAGYDESSSAKRIAHYLGSEHQEWVLSTDDVMSVIPQLGEIYDEPFGDASQVPTLLVSKLARQQVTVALSGDGGDELFMGYNRHIQAASIRWMLRSIPQSARHVAARMFRSIPTSIARQIGSLAGVPAPDEKTWKIANLLESESLANAYDRLSRAWQPGESPILAVDTMTLPARRRYEFQSPADLFARKDFAGYLPDDILTKVDRATMRNSLEARAPLLDHHVIEYAFMLPESMKLRNGVGKWPLRQVQSRYLPIALQSTVKRGFSIPLGDWLRGGLSEWVEEMLSTKSLELSQSVLDGSRVRSLWKAHKDGSANYTYYLWHALMLQAWLRQNRPYWTS